MESSQGSVSRGPRTGASRARDLFANGVRRGRRASGRSGITSRRARPGRRFAARPAIVSLQAANPIATEDRLLQSGERLGPFEIKSFLAAGGMGEVYLARDIRLERDVAIKTLPRVLAADPERLARLQREARALAALSHPNIAAIHGLEEKDGVCALVLELIEGTTLATRLERGPVPQAEALAIARQIADALDAAHEKGFVHRDLKPANSRSHPTAS